MKKKTRFEVFQRDGFTCQYCGRKPPEVVLEVDHIMPRSKNGSDDMENLITSCFDCNRGKRDKNLTDVPERIKINIEEIKERKKQLKELYKYQEEIEGKVFSSICEIAEYWEKLLEGEYSLIRRQTEGTLRRFLKESSKEEIKEAMCFAVNRVNDPEGAYRYFCGIMWNKIKKRRIELL